MHLQMHSRSLRSSLFLLPLLLSACSTDQLTGFVLQDLYSEGQQKVELVQQEFESAYEQTDMFIQDTKQKIDAAEQAWTLFQSIFE